MPDSFTMDYLEMTVVHECAALFRDALWSTAQIKWRLPGDVIAEIEREIGPRLTRRALSRAGFRPAPDESDDWVTLVQKPRKPETVQNLHPSDFGLALQVLDVGGQLQRALGLTPDTGATLRVEAGTTATFTAGEAA